MKGIDPSAPKLGPFYLEAVIFKKLQQKLGTKISLAFSPKHKFFTTICLCHQKVFTETETQKFPCLLEENLQNPCLQPQRHNTTLEAPLEILQNWKTICWHPKSSAQPFHILPQRIPTKTCMMRRRPGVKKNLTCWSRKTNIAWRLQCLTKYLHVVTFTSWSSSLPTYKQHRPDPHRGHLALEFNCNTDEFELTWSHVAT